MNIEGVLNFDYEVGGEIELAYEQDSVNKMHYFTYVDASATSEANIDGKSKDVLAVDSITRVYVKMHQDILKHFLWQKMKKFKMITGTMVLATI